MISDRILCHASPQELNLKDDGYRACPACTVAHLPSFPCLIHAYQDGERQSVRPHLVGERVLSSQSGQLPASHHSDQSPLELALCDINTQVCEEEELPWRDW